MILAPAVSSLRNQRLASNDVCVVKHMVGPLSPGFVLLISKVSFESLSCQMLLYSFVKVFMKVIVVLVIFQEKDNVLL